MEFKVGVSHKAKAYKKNAVERDDENPVHLKGSKWFSTRLPRPSDRRARKRKGRLRQELDDSLLLSQSRKSVFTSHVEVTLWLSFPLSNFLGASGHGKYFRKGCFGMVSG